MGGFVFKFLDVILNGVYWGNKTGRVMEKRGDYEKGFLKGFFGGRKAYILSLDTEEQHSFYTGETPLLDAMYSERNSIRATYSSKSENWQCKKCNRINADYVGTCACGNTKTANNQRDISAKHQGPDIKTSENVQKVSENIQNETERKPDWIEDIQSEGEIAQEWFVNMQSNPDDIKVDSEIMQNEINDSHMLSQYVDKEFVNIEKVKQYKELLDRGIISYTEYEKKRKELLDL